MKTLLIKKAASDRRYGIQRSVDPYGAKANKVVRAESEPILIHHGELLVFRGNCFVSGSQFEARL